MIIANSMKLSACIEKRTIIQALNTFQNGCYNNDSLINNAYIILVILGVIVIYLTVMIGLVILELIIVTVSADLCDCPDDSDKS